MVPERFACETLEAVPRGRAARGLARDREPEATDFEPVRAPQHREATIGAAPAAFEHPRKVLLAGEPHRTRQPDIPLYGQSFARPFARRAFSTLRPFFVAMRARNPWVRARRRLLG